MRKQEISAEDAEKLRQLSSLDEKTFSMMISSAMTALGMSGTQVAAMSKNSSKIRSMLAKASDRELAILADRLGKGKVDELLEIADSGSQTKHNHDTEF